MAKTYTTQDEIQILGPYSTRKIRTVVVGMIPAHDGALHHVAESIDAATKKVKEALDKARATNTKIILHVAGKGPALARALDVIGRFGKHLGSHQAGTIDFKAFFTVDGTASGVGRAAPKVVRALELCSIELKKKDCPVRESATWQKEIALAHDALSPTVEHADSARTDRRRLTPEVQAACGDWQQTYVAAKCSVESVLRLSQKLDLMSQIFADLAAPSKPKAPRTPKAPKAAKTPSGNAKGKAATLQASSATPKAAPGHDFLD